MAPVLFLTEKYSFNSFLNFGLKYFLPDVTLHFKIFSG
jgi:hypothetical protein